MSAPPAPLAPTQGNQGFLYELRDFLHFFIRPALTPRLRTPCTLRRLLQWALVLWAVNLLVMGPIAFSAAKMAGVEHRMNLAAIPWLHALVWAPVAEELVFRYGLRQPVKALWVLPFALPALLMGPGSHAAVLLGIALLLCYGLSTRPATPRHRYRFWHRHFGLIMHASCLAFAALHLHNFALHRTPWWILPLLVAPQWATGLVLAWLRVRRHLPASIALHALFNGGPLVLIVIALNWLDGIA